MAAVTTEAVAAVAVAAETLVAEEGVDITMAGVARGVDMGTTAGAGEAGEVTDKIGETAGRLVQHHQAAPLLVSALLSQSRGQHHDTCSR